MQEWNGAAIMARLRNNTAITAGLLLAACGGGGGVSSGGSAPPPAATPAPTPTPTPAPTPTPTSSSASAEYQASGAVVLAKAFAAYDRVITGRGVTIAILDSGIDTAGSEFRGRVSADSTGFDQRVARCATCTAETIRFDVKDVIGHGTRVAGIAAAARDGAGVQGLAPEATILALKISGPNLTGVTPTSGPVPEGEAPNGQLIAPAIRYAVEKGAFVINVSANGTAAGQTALEQRAAMDAVRAADRLVVQSVSNSTDEDSFTGKWAENLVGTDRANRDWFLFAIGLTETGQPRSANGNAGPLADRMIAAGGVAVRTVDKDGSVVVETGNSFAAPAVSGAAALLKQYWPQLGGRAIARILLDTARDAGAPGVDQIYGVGILDVENAMRAQATTAQFAAAEAAIGRYSSLTLSAPFGGSAAAEAMTGRVGGMTVLDRYGRDFAMTGSAGVRSRGSGLLAGPMFAPTDAPWRAAQAEAIRFGFASNVGPQVSPRPKVPAVFSFSPVSGQQVTLGANVAVGGVGRLSGSPLRGLASVPVGGTTAWSAGGWFASFSSGVSRDGRLRQQVVGFAMPLGLGVELSDLVERGQVLGMRGDATLGLAGARTTLATITYRRAVAGIDLIARATASSTRASGGSDLLRFGGRMLGSAFSLEGARGLFGGRATFGLSSPLRVERARAVLSTPVSFDLVAGALTTRAAAVNLVPDARELDLELGWSAALSPTSSLRFGIARAFDAGHVAGATDTAGFVTIAVR